MKTIKAHREEILAGYDMLIKTFIECLRRLPHGIGNDDLAKLSYWHSSMQRPNSSPHCWLHISLHVASSPHVESQWLAQREASAPHACMQPTPPVPQQQQPARNNAENKTTDNTNILYSSAMAELYISFL